MPVTLPSVPRTVDTIMCFTLNPADEWLRVDGPGVGTGRGLSAAGGGLGQDGGGDEGNRGSRGKGKSTH